MMVNKMKASAALLMMAVLLCFIIYAPLDSEDGSTYFNFDFVKYDSDVEVEEKTITMQLDDSIGGTTNFTFKSTKGIMLGVRDVEKGAPFDLTADDLPICEGVMTIIAKQNNTQVAKAYVNIYLVTFVWDDGSSPKQQIYISEDSLEGHAMPKGTWTYNGKEITNLKELLEIGMKGYSAELHYSGTGPFDVKFDMNGHGEQIETQSIQSGGKVAKPNDPSETGWIFKGWYKESSCINAWNFDSDTVTKPTTLYAKWEAIEYTVSFSTEHGETPSAQKHHYGDYVDKPNDPSEGGYKFVGWYKDATCLFEWDFKNDKVEESMTLYAKWDDVTVTVKFDTNGHGGAVMAQTIKYGGYVEYVKPEEPEGWKFIEWCSDKECTTAWVFSTPVYSDITLHAKWEEEIYVYTVNYSVPSGHGTVTPSSVYVVKGNTTSEPALSIDRGWYLVRWYDASTGNEWNFSTDPVMSDMTIAADLAEKAKYEVTFDLMGKGTSFKETVYDGETVTKPSNPTAYGYIFEGWCTDQACQNEYDFNTVVHSSFILYAKWVEIVYTVSFDMQGHGSQVPYQYVAAGGKVAKPEDPTASGYIFVGWFKEPLCIHVWDFDADVVVSDTTLYAMWIKETTICTVSFDMQGHGSQVPYQYVAAGGKVAKPEDPTASGYIFVGWFKESSCINAWDFDADVVVSDTILYAKWIKETTMCTVIFDMQGHGTQIEPMTVEKGCKITKPSDPSDKGWKFVGWFKESSCVNAWNFEKDVVNDNISLYAKWEESASVTNGWIVWAVLGLCILYPAIVAIWYFFPNRYRNDGNNQY